MISKGRIKDIKALHQPKFRQIYNKFIAEGEKVCTEMLNKPKFKVDAIFVTNTSDSKYQNLLRNNTAEIVFISSKEMEQISAFKTPSDILILLEKKEDSDNILLKSGTTAIYLDGVQDPGNVGTIIRTADWFGIDCVIRSHDTVDFFNSKVIQSTMGSMVNVAIFTSGIENLVSSGKRIFGAFIGEMNIYEITIGKDAIIVLGSEGNGISPLVSEAIDTKFTIPGSSGKVAESLNVAVAAGIICSHLKAFV
ncbi:MAG: RNA methyltransferase [Saprospiraceae bacterium]|nr:RNA methyltransferase [Saprospiraceae bacterium]